MTYMFSPKGVEELCSFVDAATLFAFDLDGTLAPIVDEPAAITINDEVRQALIQLNNLATVTIITGRSRSDAMSHLGFTPRFLVGNHGAEGLPGETTSAQDFTTVCNGWINQLELLLPDMSANGILLETKGQTIALHYRQASDPVKAQNSILAAFADLIPLPRVVSGIFVENIAPQDAPHKGAALESLMAHLKCTRAIFVGDDVTDEDVFNLRNPSILGVRVGNDPKSAALSYLKDQHEMVRLLREIISLLNASTRTTENLKN
ncbi:MAG: trehalose-phosphatase [Desulfuromonadaceae bacterium]|nr:trehalose-phosphatase [Desulfuromonadaceae bacterium]MDD2846830.1 trehalose-phosphatase [Desulfuromonadaceae bacterium]MDD4129192.1 trehalose-phosphatase [Desulfuromonadaceae bacterium]